MLPEGFGGGQWRWRGNRCRIVAGIGAVSVEIVEVFDGFFGNVRTADGAEDGIVTFDLIPGDRVVFRWQRTLPAFPGRHVQVELFDARFGHFFDGLVHFAAVRSSIVQGRTTEIDVREKDIAQTFSDVRFNDGHLGGEILIDHVGLLCRKRELWPVHDVANENPARSEV